MCIVPPHFVISVQDIGDCKLQYSLKYPDTKENILHKHLMNYWRWKAEGERPFGASFIQNRDEVKVQYFYDPYHSEIIYLNIMDEYQFNIQTDGGDTGDTWWNGIFRINGSEIEILQESVICS